MDDEIGVTTGDLRILGIPNPAERGLAPAEREDAVQRHGRHCRRAGYITIAVAYTATFSAAIASDSALFSDPAARLFALAAFGVLITLGGVLLSAGLAERRQQHDRALMRHVIVHQDAHAKALAHIATSLTRISQVIPIELDQRWFSGYAQGAEDDLLDTGTEGRSRNDSPIPFSRRPPRRHARRPAD